MQDLVADLQSFTLCSLPLQQKPPFPLLTPSTKPAHLLHPPSAPSVVSADRLLITTFSSSPSLHTSHFNCVLITTVFPYPLDLFQALISFILYSRLPRPAKKNYVSFWFFPFLFCLLRYN